jgi:alpha-amylase
MQLALVFHNHQPVGQLPWAFEEVWNLSYAPFLKVLEAHPQISVTLHYTGPLLDWLVKRRPATIKQLQRLVERGQVEILGGGMYEPILAVWPRPDQDAQLQRLSARVEEVFGVKPRGMWLAERVWEPQLAETIAANGLQYTFVDNTVFAEAGVEEANTFEALRATYGDAGLNVFPINKHLRELIPWHKPEEIIAYLKQVDDEHGAQALAVFADDGEKFGGWPGTYNFIFKERWLHKFFVALEKAADWLRVTTPSKYLDAHPTTQTVQLPPGSYAEMQAWAGGNWRYFLERYEESGDMHRAVRVASEQVREALQLRPTATKQRAYEHVLRAQSNDAYWHGTFGGLYLRHLRQSIYSEIAQAQVLLDGTKPFVRAVQEESGEVVLENESQRLRVHPRGGYIVEWTSKRARHNLLSTLRRHRERYHADWSETDWYARGALLDHFLRDDTTPATFASARFGEQGDFVSEAWQLEVENQSDAATIIATRRGGVWVESAFYPLEIHKRLTLRAGSDALDVQYEFYNSNSVELPLWWAHEWNMALTAWSLPERHYHADDHKLQLSLEDTAQFDAVSNPIVADRWLELWAEWEWPQPPSLWHLPIYTHSEKEGGELEKSYQQSAFLFHQRLTIPAHDVLSLSFRSVLTAKRKL